ncbi:MAG: glycoside hydrolase family 27 protein [Acidobacteriaceae bacterium]|nr:glycoside hydrolase family 27 protein [Acidobacteriaceae bacterium]
MHDGTFQDRFLDLQQNGDSVTGSLVRNYRSEKIVRGDFRDGHLHVEVNPWREVIDSYDGSLKGDELVLTIATRRSPNAPQGGTNTATATRSNAEAMKPPAPLPLPALHEVADNGLVRTPPMGWNSWNHFATKVDDAVIRAAADAIVSSGMKDAGYLYVNIDDSWEGERDSAGNITTNKKFPDMKALADYVHSKGLKIGIYSSPGPTTCGGWPGSYGHEEQDAKTYASWGFDYLKYDWCSAGAIYTNADLRPVYQKMGDALQASGRPIVYSLCEYGNGDVWTWGATVGGNLWRTTGDIADRWKSMEEIGFKQAEISTYTKAGHWNDPDMLEVGNGGMSNDEYRTHMTLWALLAAPLLAGNDLAHMSKETLELLTNKDIIAIDQDSAAHPIKRNVIQEGKTEIWTRELADGSTAVALFNRGDESVPVNAEWSKLGVNAPASGRDLWTQKDVTLSGPSYTANVPRHGVVVLRLPRS